MHIMHSALTVAPWSRCRKRRRHAEHMCSRQHMLAPGERSVPLGSGQRPCAAGNDRTRASGVYLQND